MNKKVDKSILNIDTASGLNAKSKDPIDLADITSFIPGAVLDPRSLYEKVLPIYRGVNINAKNAAKAKSRIFLPDGREIIGGTLYNIIRKYEYETKVDIFTWYQLAGEMAILLDHNAGKALSRKDVSDYPLSIRPLDPFRLSIESPKIPNKKSDVLSWRYMENDGSYPILNTKFNLTEKRDVIAFGRNFSKDGVRGTSMIRAAKNEANLYFQCISHAEQYFANNGVPNVIVSPDASAGRVGENWVKGMKAAFDRLFSFRKGQAWKTYFSSTPLKVDVLESKLKDALVADMIRIPAEKMNEVLGIPPIVSSDWSQSPGYSVAEQLESYAENTLLPMLQNFTDIIQEALVDEYADYWLKDIKVERRFNKHRTKESKDFINKQFENTDSKIIFLLDPDTLPIMAKLQVARFENIIKIKDGLNLSSNEAAEYFDVDLPMDGPDAEYRNRVLVPSGLVPLESLFKKPEPSTNEPVASPPEPAPQPEQPQTEPPAEQQRGFTTEEVNNAMKEVRNVLNIQRKSALRLAEINKRVSIRDLDSISKNMPFMTKFNRLIYNKIASCDNDVDSVKKVFSHIPKKIKKQMAIEYIRYEKRREEN